MNQDNNQQTPVATALQTQPAAQPAAPVKPKYVLTAKQLADEYLILGTVATFQYRKKLDQLAASLRMGSEHLPYRPAGTVLKALLLMCRMSNRNGSFRPFKQQLFTPYNQRITSRKEILQYCSESLGCPLTKDQLRRAMAVLKDEKLIFATKGRYGNNQGSIMYVKFNCGVLWQRLTQADRAAAPPIVTRVVPVDFDERSELDWKPQLKATEKPSGDNPPPDDKSAHSIIPQNGTGSVDDPQVSAPPVDCDSSSTGLIRELIEEGGCATGSCASKTPIAERYDNPIPEESSVAFHLTPEQDAVIRFIETNPVLLDECKVHNPVDLSARQVKGILRLMENDKLTLRFMEQYFGAVSGTYDEYRVETHVDAWWLNRTPEEFINFFRPIRHAMRIAQAQAELDMMFLCRAENQLDPKVVLRGIVGGIDWTVGTWLEEKTDAEIRLHFLDGRMRDLYPAFCFDALLAFEVAGNSLSPELYAELRAFHLPNGRYYAMEVRPDAVVALEEAGLDVASLFALSPAELQTTHDQYREMRARFALREMELRRVLNTVAATRKKKLPAAETAAPAADEHPPGPAAETPPATN